MTQPPPSLDSAQAGGRNASRGNDPLLPSIVASLTTLIEQQAKFSTIYADPPWPYTNTAARGAAENHYRTLSLEVIRNQPVKELAAEQAHLHLWTTNAFLHAAFSVIRAWGFRYKSCLVWVKPQIGLARRTAHSRKPFPFRDLIERVSLGPYLELYGREEQPNSGWTVYGNEVERRLFRWHPSLQIQ